MSATNTETTDRIKTAKWLRELAKSMTEGDPVAAGKLIVAAKMIERQFGPNDEAMEVLRAHIIQMGKDHIISGGPGPLYGAGYAAACENWSKKLLAIMDRRDATNDEATKEKRNG